MLAASAHEQIKCFPHEGLNRSALLDRHYVQCPTQFRAEVAKDTLLPLTRWPTLAIDIWRIGRSD